MAQDRAGSSSASVVAVSLVVAPVPVALDALIAPGASPATGDYVGEGVVSLDPALQSVTQTIDAGATQSFSVQVRKRGPSAEVTLKAHASIDGWTIAYFDGVGNNITAALQGTGWRKTMADGESVEVSVQVAPPRSAPEGERCAVVISAQAQTAGSGSTEADVVRALAIAKAALTPPSQPDILIRLTPSDDDIETPYTDDGIYNSDGANQSAQTPSIPGTPVSFDLQLQNDGPNASALRLHLPDAPPDWSATLFKFGGHQIGGHNT